MAAASEYPRPDFERAPLRWQSLDGAWDFIFDDGDAGLASQWPRTGLPEEVGGEHDSADNAEHEHDDAWAEARAITHKIAALPDRLQHSAHARTKTTNTKRQITVPYVFQCAASGIDEQSAHEVLWYERRVEDIRSADDIARGDRLLLRFGAVDYHATVWVDGHFAGDHRGGHVPFDIDISDAFDAGSPGPKRLTLRVFDSTADLHQPRGKQYWGAKPESIFYTPSSGIWQSVWLEAVPSARLGDASAGTVLEGDVDGNLLRCTVAVEGRATARLRVEAAASLGGVPLHTVSARAASGTAVLALPVRVGKEVYDALPESVRAAAPWASTERWPAWRAGVALWSPAHPTLYTITLRLYEGDNLLDTVVTTAGMRSLAWDGGAVSLNGRPLFQALVLDQGYWPQTLMTPRGDDLRKDILFAQAMGFNGCRKHQKVEDPRFLYWADRLGFLVWAEMANAYAYSGLAARRFDAEWAAAVRRDRNHASVVAWTPVNESWGYPDLGSAAQRNHVRSLYYATKVLDASRPVNDNCGWEHVATDLTTFHDYSDGAELAATCATLDKILAPKAGRPLFVPPIPGDAGAAHRPGAPVLCTEFGGVNIAAKAGSEDWGYTTAADPADLLARFAGLVSGVTAGGHICGFVYTQLADIEQEANGLYSAARIAKLDASAVKAVVDAAGEAYYKQVEERSRVS